MKILIFPLIALSFQVLAGNNYSDSICRENAQSIYFPMDAPNFPTKPLGACFANKNITKKLSGPWDITSAVFDGIGNINYYTIGTDGDGSQYDHTKIMAASVNKDGDIVTAEVMDSGKPDWDDPKKTLYNMQVTGYDWRTARLYFETDAWATSGAVHILQMEGNSSIRIKYHKFITDGSVSAVTDKGVVVERTGDDENKSFSHSYLYDNSEKKVCIVNTRDKYWSVYADCIEGG